jgi:four helix bundle protein
MRDHTKLRAFQLADELVLLIYTATKLFPDDERFGMMSQMRRASASVPYNNVEGCARSTHAEYLRFLDVAYGSARELEYQISLAYRLGYLDDGVHRRLREASVETCKVLNGLIRSLRQPS